MDYNLIINLFSLVCGIYCVYVWYRLHTGRRLFENSLIIPKGKTPADCCDEEGYIAALLPKVGVLGAVTTIFGVLNLANDMLPEPFLPYPWALIPVGVVLAVLVWYAVATGRAVRDYFGA